MAEETLVGLKREEHARAAHHMWSEWMTHMLTLGIINRDGSYTVRKEHIERWTRQMNTPYDSLTEAEKDSDRQIADRYLSQKTIVDQTTQVTVTFTKAGWHQWNDAPSGRSYLRHSHRHLFYFEVSVEVTDDDREIEFHDLLHFCEENCGGPEYGGRSCEMIAKYLSVHLINKYGKSVVVTVSEDGEVGATVTTKVRG